MKKATEPGSGAKLQCFSFMQGYSGGLLYDGQYIANTTGTVVVTVNYRLGALGFLVYGSSITGNYAIKVGS